jgi:hypothetical protein
MNVFVTAALDDLHKVLEPYYRAPRRIADAISV